MDDNKYKCLLFVGTNGTGKTQLMVNYLIDKGFKRNIILTPDDFEPKLKPFTEILPEQIKVFKKGTAKIIPDNNDQIKELFENLQPVDTTAVVFDDAKNFLNRNYMQVEKYFRRRRQYQIEIIMMFHGISDVIPSLWGFATHLVLFHTTDSIKRSYSSIPNIKLIEQAQTQVNFSKNPYNYLVIDLKK